MSSRELLVHPNQILFEDDDLIAVSKPPGLPTQATRDPNRPHLYGLLTEFIKRRDGPKAYLALHHRLDLDTTGVVLFVKSRRANAPVGEMFQKHQIQKTYLALVQPFRDKVESLDERRMDLFSQGAWVTIKDYLKSFEYQDPIKKRKFQKMTVTSSGGDLAITDFRKSGSWNNGVFLIEAQPKSGRMHQIRVHLAAEMGMAILGDRLYGPPRDLIKVRRILLHASRLEFSHPFTKTSVSIECPTPGDFQSAIEKLAGLALPNQKG